MVALKPCPALRAREGASEWGNDVVSLQVELADAFGSICHDGLLKYLSKVRGRRPRS